MIRGLYTLVLTTALAVYAPVVAVRRLFRRGHPVHLRQRLGHLGAELPAEPRCWIHAVSVGEVIAAMPLIEGIRRQWPAVNIVLTTVTPTGARVVADRLNGAVTHRYFPLDLPGPVERALAAIRPHFFIGMETELWPNFLDALARRRIPSMIANGRLSDRSFRRYRWVRFLTRPMLESITVLGMQSQEDARRAIALGAPPERVVVTGSLKTDAVVDGPGARELWERLLGLGPRERIWVAGSTHRGEDEVMAEVFTRLRADYRDLVLLLAPRHPERVSEVERMLQERGLATVRRSRLPTARAAAPVIILDTVGELAPLYHLAEAVFVGGSLVPTGGHNMLEPALRSKPVLFGPYTSNFRESAEMLLEAGGARRVTDAAGLESALRELLEKPDVARAMGEAGQQAVVRRQGGVQATLELVSRYLGGGEAMSRNG
ncbi:MAG TPA: 3-deoxy-D-manno-octulosonic acid transferase [Methylomirabilota bacterium]|nr:3-deoxy-D-manno-octulosonic acid transferase [Methylomirabilota bacterium]